MMWIHFKNTGKMSDSGFSGRKRAVVMPVLSDTIHVHTKCCHHVFKTYIIVIPFLEIFLLVLTRLENVGWLNDDRGTPTTLAAISVMCSL